MSLVVGWTRDRVSSCTYRIGMKASQCMVNSENDKEVRCREARGVYGYFL